MEANQIQQRPELFFGFVSPLGVDLKLPISFLDDCLKTFEYKTEEIHLINLLQKFKDYEEIFKIPDYYKKAEELIKVGNEFRKKLERKDALALLAISHICTIRERENTNIKENKNRIPLKNQAYILRSLKTPEEVDSLRKIYQSSFYLISVYSNIESRKNYLLEKIKEGQAKVSDSKNNIKATELIEKDKKESIRFGQNVSDTFPLADLFINIDDITDAKYQIERFVSLIFAFSYDTPNPQEYAMFHAKAAALRSGSLARQVGAVITDNKNEIISIGTNEVPKPNGGQYWNGDNPDYRDNNLGFDKSDTLRIQAVKDLLSLLKEKNVLKPDDLDIPIFVDKLLYEDPDNLLKKSLIMSSIEYARAVHAEMGALMNASRRGISVQNCNLFVTTFPCHDCAKHIVHAGIQKVYYIEPYPKSLVSELLFDSIQVEENKTLPGVTPIKFEPFVGISPNKYFDLFTMQDRKDKKGKKIEKIKKLCIPKNHESSLSYIQKETDIIIELDK